MNTTLPSSTFSQQLRALGLHPMPAVVASVSSLFRLSGHELNAIQFDLVREAFDFHYKNNQFYQNLCNEKNVKPDQLQGFADLVRIPLIPVAHFKSMDSHRLLTMPLNAIELEMRSTGTSGLPSVARRCSQTVDHVVLGMYAMYREFLAISKGAGLYLCPSPEEIPEMGMIKALNLLAGLLDTHRFMINQERFVPEEALAQLQTWNKQFNRHIIGPPFLIHRFLQFLKQTGQTLKLDRDTLVITLGGWRRFGGQMISRLEFNLMCEKYLGVNSSHVRDIYALVESNVIAIEDEYHIKHASPYVHLSVRNPDKLDQEVPLGQPGVLAILDPSAVATPGMILTEDIVRLLPEPSPTGRGGQRLEYIMRAPCSLEFGCCAVNLEKKMDADAALAIRS